MNAMIDEEKAAEALAALGNATRLRLFRLLVRVGPAGMNTGEVQRRLDIPGSTLNHHVGALVRAGLVRRERRGREVVCTTDYPAMDALLDFLRAECCAEVAIAPAESEPAA